MLSLELISAIIALVSMVVSAVSLFRVRKVHARQLELQQEQLELRRTTEKLHAKQLQQLETQQLTAARGRVLASLESMGRDQRFTIANTGEVSVSNVTFELVNCESSPLLRGERDQKLPVKLLHPGTAVHLMAAIGHSKPLSYVARVGWLDPDGTSRTEDFHVSI